MIACVASVRQTIFVGLGVTRVYSAVRKPSAPLHGGPSLAPLVVFEYQHDQHGQSER
jgi:hypothetical protein